MVSFEEKMANYQVFFFPCGSFASQISSAMGGTGIK
jgi:hypothetical protein